MRGLARIARARLQTRCRCPPEELHAALAHNGVILLFELFGEFVHARNPAGPQDFFFAGRGTGETDVFANRAVKQERVLQDHAQVDAVRIQADGRKVLAIQQQLARTRFVKRGHQTDDG